MDNWVKKVLTSKSLASYAMLTLHLQIGFPVVTVTETDEGVTVKQNRFLQTGPAEPQDDETIWSVFAYG